MNKSKKFPKLEKIFLNILISSVKNNDEIKCFIKI